MSRAKTISITVGSLAVGAILATGITGIAAAANGSPSPSPSTSTHTAPQQGHGGSLRSAPDGLGRHGGHGGGLGGPRGGMLGGPGGQALHGEFVVKAADGTISTVRMIRGAVTAVDASSITVKADDGYSSTFAVTSTTDIHVGAPIGHGPNDQGAAGTGTQPVTPAASTIADVKVGDVADVEGSVSGSTATATEIRSMTAAEAAQLEQQRQAHEQQEAQQQSSTSSSAKSSSSAA